MSSRVISILALAATTFLVAACGGGESSSGDRHAQLVGGQPAGRVVPEGGRSTAPSSPAARTRSVYQLGTDADIQRQSLVRRLAAEDSSIDLMAMDVIWTAEFAEADWIKPFPREDPRRGLARARSRARSRPRPTRASSTARPATPTPSCSGTARTRSRATPPKTWDELIDTAAKLNEATASRSRRAAYEGTTVWFNSLDPVRRRHDPRGPRQGALEPEPTRKALEIIAKLATSSAGRPVARQRRRRTRTAWPSSTARPPSRSTTRSSTRRPGARRRSRASRTRSAGRRTRAVKDGHAGQGARSAASTAASATTPSTPRRPSTPPPACATSATSGRLDARAGCRRRSVASTTTRSSRRTTRSRT